MISKFFLLRKFLIINMSPLWRKALWRFHIAAGVEHIAALSCLDSLRMVVDVGANKGQFALAIRQRFPETYILSFEPLVEPASLYRVLFRNDDRVRLVEAAIGVEACEAEIHVSARDDSSSLLPITAQQSLFFPGTAEIGVRKVQIIRLEDAIEFLHEPALLKIDVQGYEMQVLEGCGDYLYRFTWVYVECSFVELYEGQALADAVISWLRCHGFSLRGVYNMTYDDSGKSIQGDFLFSRSSSFEDPSV